MQSRCWVTKDRYYHVSVNKDLFGRWSVVKSWGGRHNRLGSSEALAIEDLNDVNVLLSGIEKQRMKRGYYELKI